MRLVHYSDRPIGTLEVRAQAPAPIHEGFKPLGLWVSDDDCEDNWRAWCISTGIVLEQLTHVHDVDLAPDANVLRLTSASEIRAFTRDWSFVDPDFSVIRQIRWPDVMTAYDGMIITPYIWSMRLDMESFWYYGWDCASGCIWHPRAIALVRLREVVPVPEHVA
jgi:hypothetical protein